ncbi:hypothetical protein ACFLYW_01475 [Thermodesulfobacteriota bacterium]
MKTKMITKYSILGALAGYLIFHPLVMALAFFMTGYNAQTGFAISGNLFGVLLNSFSVSMLPWSVSFAFFNGVIGLYYGTVKKTNLAREKLIRDLQKALSEVKTLSGMLPICSSCKNIRNDEGYWQQIEDYISKHSDLDFTHGICDGCVKKLYPELYPKLKEKMKIQ